uniref:Uncharacterized protein n=1 Tax=Helianthus annuus TaxID=4232 RepID=A0A251U4V1_HELAN
MELTDPDPDFGEGIAEPVEAYRGLNSSTLCPGEAKTQTPRVHTHTRLRARSFLSETPGTGHNCN